MSKLDDILKFAEPNSWESEQKKAKQQIIDLMLEFIGNEPQVYQRYLVVRHKLGLEENQSQAKLIAKAVELYQKELRQKVNEL